MINNEEELINVKVSKETLTEFYKFIGRSNSERSVNINRTDWDTMQPGCYFDADLKEALRIANDILDINQKINVLPKLSSNSAVTCLANENDPEELRKFLGTLKLRTIRHKSDFENKIVIENQSDKYFLYKRECGPKYELDFLRNKIYIDPGNGLSTMLSFEAFLLMAKLVEVIVEKNEKENYEKFHNEFLKRVGNRKVVLTAVEYTPNLLAHPRSKKLPYFIKDLFKENKLAESRFLYGSSKIEERYVLHYNDNDKVLDFETGDYIALAGDSKTVIRIPKDELNNYYIFDREETIHDFGS